MPAPARVHQQVGRGVQLRHAVLVADHAVQDAARAVAFGDSPVDEPLADGVVHGQIGVVGEALDGGDDDLVDVLRAERAAGHGDDEAVGRAGRARAGPRRGRGRGRGDDRLAHRRTGDLGVRQRRAGEGHGDGGGAAGAAAWTPARGAGRS